MTLNEAYLANHNDQPVPDTKELVIEWLDHIVACKQKLNALMKEMQDLGTGKKVNGSYENNYQLSIGNEPKEIFIHNGIDRLAEYLDVELIEEPRIPCNKYPWKYSFKYRGFIFYQIEKERHESWI